MKTKFMATIAILAIMVAGIASFAYAQTNTANDTSSTSTTTASQHSQQHPDKGDHPAHPVQAKDSKSDDSDHDDDDEGHASNKLSLKVGDTITLSNLQGQYRQMGNSSIKGNASGSFTFTVTGAFKQGYTISIPSGTITIGSTTFTVSSGTALIPGHGRELVGQGTAGNGVAFIIRAEIIGQPNATHGTAMLDLQNGSTEYMVLLRTPSS